MEQKAELALKRFNAYVDSFGGLTDEQVNNLEIKREHSFRVADIAMMLARKMELNETEIYLAYLIGLFHDVGRFAQLKEYNTFNDATSIDHADYGVDILTQNSFFEDIDEEEINLILFAIRLHNKLMLPKKMSEKERLFAQLIRDADKLDILRVITDYYSNPKATPNHTLTWEMPKGVVVSPKVSKEILNGNLVSKETVANDLDIKVMQLSWVFDLNYKPSFEIMVNNRYIEKIYSTMPKNDTVIEIYRKVKVFTENKVSA